MIVVNKEELMRVLVDLDYCQEPEYLLENYKNELTRRQIKVIEGYRANMEDEDYLDSDEQESTIGIIHGYFGITEDDWEVFEV